MTCIVKCKITDKYAKMSNYEVKKVDLRVNRTKKLLSEALLKMLEKKLFSKINVNDLCLEAMVSRAAFYTHFVDKYDLLRYSLKRIKDAYLQERPLYPRKESLVMLVDYIEEYRSVFEHLIYDDNSYELQMMFNELFIEDTLQEIEKMDSHNLISDMQKELIASFISGGISNLLIRWIARKFSFGREELAEMLETLMSPREEMQKIGLLEYNGARKDNDKK